MNSFTGFREVAKSIYIILTDTGLTVGGSSVPVYWYPPEGTAKPYIVIGDMTAVPDQSHDRYARMVTVEVSAWLDDTGNGPYDADDLMSDVAAALEDASAWTQEEYVLSPTGAADPVNVGQTIDWITWRAAGGVAECVRIPEGTEKGTYRVTVPFTAHIGETR
jgi:hypothetical protein